MSVRDLLFDDPFARIDRKLVSDRVRRRLGPLIPDDIGPHIGALSRFVDDRPWRYWSDETVKAALTLFEADAVRTYAAIESRVDEVHRGLHVLLQQPTAPLDESALPIGAANSYLRLSEAYLPAYLGCAEHVLGNLLSLVWSVARSGGVDAKFRLRNAVAQLRQLGHGSLTDGYDDAVRNAIAHGEVRFTGAEVEFGSTHPARLTPSDCLDLYDRVVRSSNAIALAILLFWLRNAGHRPLEQPTPLSLAGQLAAGPLQRGGLALIGVVDSKTPLAGHQLHAAVKLSFRQREWVLGEAARVAARLIEVGAHEYDRFLVEVDHGGPVSSLVIVKPAVLKDLLESNAEWTRLDEAFPETQLLWYNESQWRTRLRGLTLIAQAALRQWRTGVVQQWHEASLWLGKGRFWVRDIKNRSTQGVARVHITAVLKNPSDADDRGIVVEVLDELVKLGRRRLVRSRGPMLDPGVPWLKRPVHVFVALYRVDGSKRWLARRGWLAGNVVAVAERTWQNRLPVFVDNPELVYRRMRIRLSIDAEAALEAWKNVEKLAESVRKRNRAS